MTIINFKVDREKKKKIEEITRIKGYASVSEFIREAIDEKMTLQQVVDDFLEKNPPFERDKIEIPDFIPDGKYLGIARNEIVIIGDSLGEVMQKLYEKFPESATSIIRKGEEMEQFETLYSLFSPTNTKCYHQAEIGNRFYAILEIGIKVNEEMISLLGLIDTGASIVALDENFIKEHELDDSKNKKKIMTANGIIDLPIYSGKFHYEDQSYDLEFTSAQLTSHFGIKALLGKNFIDAFNVLFLGKEKLFCIQKY